MATQYPTAERIRALFSCENGKLFYRVAPYHKPALLGKEAGYTDKRDGITYVKVGHKAYVRDHIAVIWVTGKPPVSHKDVELTHMRLLDTLGYDQQTGVFTRTKSGKGIKVGSRADYKENSGYRCVNLDGKRYLAARLAWFYVNGEWPKSMLRFQDGDEQNCSISNLAYGKWTFATSEDRAAHARAHRIENRGIYHDRDLRKDFGLSRDQYEDMLVAQGGVCAICKRHEIQMRSGNRKKLAIDHDHSDGTFRGLLCAACNSALGHFEDDAVRLRAAAAYLEAHAAKPKTNVIPLAGRRIANSKGETS